MALTYAYDTGQLSHYAVKKAWGSCHENPDKTRLIGVMCKNCRHYLGNMMADDEDGDRTYYVLCEWHKDDDEGVPKSLRSKIYDRIKNNALCALDY